MLSSLFALAALAARVSAAQCDLSFATHQIHLVSNDGSAPDAIFNGGCLFGFFGAGCTWQRQISSPLDGYTIGHSPISAFGIPGGPAPVNVTGNGCDGTILTCVGDGPKAVPITGPDGNYYGTMYTYYTNCSMSGDNVAADNLEPATELAMSLAPNGCSTCSLTTAGPATSTVAPPALTCYNVAEPDNCIADYVSCGDGVASIGYPGTITDWTNPESTLPTESPYTSLPPPAEASCTPKD